MITQQNPSHEMDSAVYIAYITEYLKLRFCLKQKQHVCQNGSRFSSVDP
jgi:hypothetical protein